MDATEVEPTRAELRKKRREARRKGRQDDTEHRVGEQGRTGRKKRRRKLRTEQRHRESANSES